MKTQFCIFILFLALGQGYTQSNLLQYHAPARYFEEALPIGNGKQGAMIYSGIDHDRLSLNDITLWSGEPYNPANNPDAFNYLAPVRKALFKEDYAAADTLVRHIQGKFSEAYQPLGNLMIHLDQNVNDVQNFTRTVDLDKALVKSEYQIDDTKYTKSYFASYPDKLIVINIAAQGSKKLNGSLSFNSPHPNKVLSSAHELFMTGRAPVHSEPNYNRTNNPLIYVDGHGTRFAARLNVLNENGSIALSDTSIIFKDCNSLEIRLSLATSFNGYNKDPFTQGLDELKISSNQLVNAKKYSYTQLISRHQKNYSSLYDRVRFQLGENNAGKDDTYHRLKDNTDLANDLSLINLYFNFGRYLLISSSRTSHVPINLQGLWNEAVRPPWSSNYTININTEMNYWPIETCNLSELHQPLLSFLGDLSKTGTITASTYYHTRGWTAHHNSDIWAMSNPVGNFGKGSPQWANWAMGGAWLSTHIWEHYLFTKDKKYLTNSYDILKNQCRFLLDFLVKDTYGHLVTAPSTSPENVYMNDKGFKGATMYGGTSDLALIRQVFNNTILAANELKRDPAFKDSLSNALVQLSPYKISSQGWLQEWYYDWDDPEVNHRHLSHLIGVYPGNSITVKEIPLYDAVKKSLLRRTNNGTGWSIAWKIALWARLHDGEMAFDAIKKIMSYYPADKNEIIMHGGGTYPNLFDAHPPFQIDGNFGAIAGMAEMILQSHTDAIEILPALPSKWKDGKMEGLKARGNITVDVHWKDHVLSELKLLSKSSGIKKIKYMGKIKEVNLRANQWSILKPADF